MPLFEVACKDWAEGELEDLPVVLQLPGSRTRLTPAPPGYQARAHSFAPESLPLTAQAFFLLAPGG